MTRGSALVLLAMLGAGVFLAGLELMVTAVALPSIVVDLADWSALRTASWIVNGYLLAFFREPEAATLALAMYVRHLFWSFPVQRLYTQFPLVGTGAAYLALYEAAGSAHKELKVFTEAETGAMHCQNDNRILAHDYIADWLSDVLVRGRGRGGVFVGLKESA